MKYVFRLKQIDTDQGNIFFLDQNDLFRKIMSNNLVEGSGCLLIVLCSPLCQKLPNNKPKYVFSVARIKSIEGTKLWEHHEKMFDM